MWKRMERRWSQFTESDVQMLADMTPYEKYGTSWLAKGEYMPPFSEKLTGKTIEIQLDCQDIYIYSFKENQKLIWQCNGGKWHEEKSQILETPGEPDIILVEHYCEKSNPPTAHTIVLDFQTGLVTMCLAKIGNAYSAREVQRKFLFGKMAKYMDCGFRHTFTDELVGKAIDWTYHEKNGVKIKHIYTAPLYYTYEMRQTEEKKCWIASNPADYVKINDHVYIFSFIEERQAGVQGFFLINLEILHDIGMFFGVQAHGIECYTFGAKGELTSPYALDLCERKK